MNVCPFRIDQTREHHVCVNQEVQLYRRKLMEDLNIEEIYKRGYVFLGFGFFFL